MILGKQIKAGRILLGIKQEELADKSGIPIATLKRIENNLNKSGGSAVNFEKIKKFFEDNGVIFDEDSKARIIKILK